MRGPLFIVGPARSGTTLVRALLGAHRSIELRNEPELILSLVRAGVGPDDVVPREDRVRLLLDLAHTGLTRQHVSALPPAAIEEFLTARNDLGFTDVYELLLPRPEEGVVWGDKSLGNSFLLRQISRAYPDALFVHVLRDPRATTRSYANLHYLGDDGPELPFEREAIGFVAAASMRWASATDAIDAASDSLPNGSLAKVRFEQLVEEPAAVLRQICALVSVDFDPEMLEPERRHGDPVLESRRYAHGRLSQPVDPSRAAAGDDLPPWAVAVVERYAGAAMTRHGYEARGVSLSPEVRETLARELDFLEPIVQARIAREEARRTPGGRRAEQLEPAERATTSKLDSLAKLAATAERRRGDETDSRTEVEVLRHLAAAALEELEAARRAAVRTRQRKERRKKRGT